MFTRQRAVRSFTLLNLGSHVGVPGKEVGAERPRGNANDEGNVSLTPAFSLRPEFRTYSSVAMSPVNLGMHRGAIGVRYPW